MNSYDVQAGSELAFRILSEIPDVIVATDLEDHVLYWNRRAEEIYRLPAPDALGQRLGACCPDLHRALAERDLPQWCLAQGQSWRGEIILRARSAEPVPFALAVSLLGELDGVAGGILYVHRDIREIKRIECELSRARELLECPQTRPAPVPSDVPIGNDLRRGGEIGASRSPAHPVILWAEDDDNDAALMSRAWQKAQVEEELIRVRNGAEAIDYLTGEGPYENRLRHPLPRLLVLDLNLPDMSGLDVVQWLHGQPQFKEIPVVILTCSDAPAAVHQSAQFGVKGYLVKPVDGAEWLSKVRTLTSQCL